MNRMARAAAAAAAGVLIIATLSACGGGEPVSAPTPGQSGSPSSSASPTPSARVPVLRPDGSAAANKQFFDYVNKEFNAQFGMADGRSIVDNLASRGFVKADMELTFDTTALEIPVDSIVFSVRIQNACLIGQFSASGYSSLEAPLLGTGRCLVGTTRPIDW